MPTNYKACAALPSDLQRKLTQIYYNAESHVVHFDMHLPNGGSFVNDQIWPETHDDYQWILDNILPYYGIEYDDVAVLDYSNSGGGDRDAFSGGPVPDYEKNSINFTRFTPERASINTHHAGVPHVLCKLNIPITGMEQASVYWTETDEGYNYVNKTACLLNVQELHTVMGLNELTEERTFLSIALMTPFADSIDSSKVLSN